MEEKIKKCEIFKGCGMDWFFAITERGYNYVIGIFDPMKYSIDTKPFIGSTVSQAKKLFNNIYI